MRRILVALVVLVGVGIANSANAQSITLTSVQPTGTAGELRLKGTITTAGGDTFTSGQPTFWKKGSGPVLLKGAINADGAYDVTIGGLTSGQGYNVTVQVTWKLAGTWCSDPGNGSPK